MAQQPLQVAVRHPWLVLGLHVPALVGLCPHQPALIVLDTHDTLGTVHSGHLVLSVDVGVVQVGQSDRNWGAGGRLEAQLAMPGHVLDREQGTVGQNDHVIVTIADKHTVCRLDHLREDMLDGVGREVTLLLGPTRATHKDGLVRALGPLDARSVQGTLDVFAIKVDRGAGGLVDQFRGEGKNIPRKRTHQVDLVDVEAGVDSHGGGVDHIKNVALRIARVVEHLGRLDTGGRKH